MIGHVTRVSRPPTVMDLAESSTIRPRPEAYFSPTQNTSPDRTLGTPKAGGAVEGEGVRRIVRYCIEVLPPICSDTRFPGRCPSGQPAVTEDDEWNDSLLSGGQARTDRKRSLVALHAERHYNAHPTEREMSLVVRAAPNITVL